MAHVVKSVRTAWPAQTAFAYMADFSHAAEWDPSVVEASRMDTGTIGVGSVFDLAIRAGGRRLPLRYEVTDFVPGRVTFTARSTTFASVDTVTVTDQSGATRVTYDARIRLRGALRLADPLLALGFRRVAHRAIRGLERRLSEVP